VTEQETLENIADAIREYQEVAGELARPQHRPRSRDRGVVVPTLPGINHLDAVRALEKARFWIERQGCRSMSFASCCDRLMPEPTALETTMRVRLILTTVVCLSIGAIANAATIIHAGRLIDGKNGQSQAEMSIVIEDGRIASVVSGYVPRKQATSSLTCACRP